MNWEWNSLTQSQDAAPTSDILPNDIVSVLAITPGDAPRIGLSAYRHYCAALRMEVCIEIYRARVGFTNVQFCCYCGLRVGRHPPTSAGRDWDCLTARDLASRWLGNDATIIQEWIEPDGHTRLSLARSRGPLLEFLLSRLRGIARRRRDRLSRALDTANREFGAVWLTEQILDSARAPYESEAPDLRIGFVYAISNGTHLKIGWSTSHPQLSRVRDLQVASAHELDIVGAFIGTQTDERSTQQRFGPYRVRGEWFQDVPQIRAYFKSRSRSDKNADHSA
jgi:hypothetical protein